MVHFTSASSCMPCMMPCRPPLTSTSGMEKTPCAPSVHLLQTSNILVASKITCHMAIFYGSTTRSSSACHSGDQAEEDQWPASFIIPSCIVSCFIREGAKPTKVQTTAGIEQLKGARDWKLVADLNQRLRFPSEIPTADLRPDLMLWSALHHSTFHSTVPWEVLWKRLSSTRALNMLSWQLMESQGLSNGRPLQRLFGQSSGFLRTWEFEAKRNVKPSKPCQAQQKKQLSGSEWKGNTPPGPQIKRVACEG